MRRHWGGGGPGVVPVMRLRFYLFIFQKGATDSESSDPPERPHGAAAP